MAYTLTPEDVLALAPELLELDDDLLATAIDTAKTIVANLDAWGSDAKAKKAAVYLAAHCGKLAFVASASKGSAPAQGPVSQITVGPISKSFAMMGPSMRQELDAWLALTPYGVTFRTLQRLFSFGRMIVT